MLVHDVFLISRFREAMVCRMLRGILLSHILPRNPAAKVRRAVHFFLNPAGGIHTGSTTQVASPGKGGRLRWRNSAALRALQSAGDLACHPMTGSFYRKFCPRA